MNGSVIAVNTLATSKLKAGVGHYTVNLVNELSNIDQRNRYIVLVGQENAKDYSSLGPNFDVVVVNFFNKNRPLRMFWEQFVLPFELKMRGVDILISPVFISPLFMPCRSVVTVHDMTFFSHPEYHEASKVFYFQKMIPKVVQKADHILAVSHSTKRDITKFLGTSSAKISVTPLAAHSRYRNLKLQREPAILFVGTLEPRKNIPSLLQAFGRLPEPYTLWIVGAKGWGWNEVEENIRSNPNRDRIKLFGYLADDELVELFNRASVFVYPSFYEGFGIPVLEAMASGCPVITSNNSSLAEIAHGAAELLEDPSSVDELDKKLRFILGNPDLRERLAESGLQRASEYSWRRMAELTLRVVESQIMNVAERANSDSNQSPDRSQEKTKNSRY